MSFKIRLSWKQQDPSPMTYHAKLFPGKITKFGVDCVNSFKFASMHLNLVEASNACSIEISLKSIFKQNYF